MLRNDPHTRMLWNNLSIRNQVIAKFFKLFTVKTLILDIPYICLIFIYRAFNYFSNRTGLNILCLKYLCRKGLVLIEPRIFQAKFVLLILNA